ncbi:hypothetical protein V8G54_025130 [Vigna mungo]|uniref:Uncharacterized protein n=1 Tax=Vigna mungo TaxID=3915 RepID=A0AAQ3RTU1_VIGMU
MLKWPWSEAGRKGAAARFWHAVKRTRGEATTFLMRIGVGAAMLRKVWILEKRRRKRKRVDAGDDDSSYAQQCHHGRHRERETEPDFLSKNYKYQRQEAYNTMHIFHLQFIFESY